MRYYLEKNVIESRAKELFENNPSKWLNTRFIRQNVYEMEAEDEYVVSSCIKESMMVRLRTILKRMQSQGLIESRQSSKIGHTLEWRKIGGEV